MFPWAHNVRVLEAGFEVRPGEFSGAEVEALLERLPPVPEGAAGSRDLHELPWLLEFARSSRIAEAAFDVLGVEAKPVRILFFDKQVGSNWKLPYHQDLTIAVAAQADAPGYGPWTMKAGIPHVQPPVAILEQMIAVRLHVDDCGEANGALRVIPGSHGAGRLAAAEIDALIQEGREEVVEAKAGDLVLMRPLLVHASSPASQPSHRRVLHIEYSTAELPPPLGWFMDDLN